MRRKEKKLHNEELHVPYSSLNIIWVVKSNTIGKKCSTHMETTNISMILVVKARRKKRATWEILRTRHRWKSNIKIYLQIGV
jgi:hypothetical protein